VNTLMRIKLSCCPLYQHVKKLNDDHKYRAKMEMLVIMRKARKPSMRNVLPLHFLYHRHMSIISNPTSTVSNIPNNRTVNSPNVSDALSNQSSEFLDIL
jgi:hypothetical protein